MFHYVRLDFEPAASEIDSGPGSGDVHRLVLAQSVRRQSENSIACAKTDHVTAAVGQLLVEGAIYRYVWPHVGAVHPVEPTLLQLSQRQKAHQFIGKHHVDIGGENELATGPANANILSDHLVQRQRRGVPVTAVQFPMETP